jgi:hypothetical protein
MRTWASILKKRARLHPVAKRTYRFIQRPQARNDDNGSIEVKTCPLCKKGQGGSHGAHHRIRERIK